MILKVYLKPNSKEQKIQKISDSEYKIFVKSKPIENKANYELIKILANYLNIKSSNISIISGAKSKIKILKIIT
jgi:uncharacterized protein (TIGR00251 family)